MHLTYLTVGATKMMFFLFIQEKPKSPKAQVDAIFFRRILKLLKIGIPGMLSPEFGIVFVVAASLIGRTLCDLFLIKRTTEIETYVTFLI